MNLKKYYFILPILLNVIFGQISVSDLNKLSQQQLDLIKNELQASNSTAPNVKKNDSSSSLPEVIELASEMKSVSESNFGYSFFQRDIQFFDNIPTPSDYKLGPGDEIILSLWGESNSREKFIINKDGQIYYSNIGFIGLSNKTIEEAENFLLNELSEVHSTLGDQENPTELKLEIGRLKSINIFFSGEVFNPGISLVHPFSDLFSALAQVGGVKTSGSLRCVELIRNNETIYTADFYSFFMNGKNTFSDIKLVDGDVIHIPNIKKRVIISGNVNRPSSFELLEGESISELITYAAGFSSKASSSLIIDKITPVEKRNSDDNAITSIVITLNDFKEINLNDGDQIYVPSITPVDSKVTVYGKVKSPGQYPALKYFSNNQREVTLKDVLDLAGGFNDPIFRKSIDDNIVVLRLDKDQFYGKKFSINYDASENFILEVNDKIFVYEDSNYNNDFTFTIKGEVNKPGTYPLKDGLTLSEAVSLAGGLTEIGSINSLTVSKPLIRLNNTGNEIEEFEYVKNIGLDFIISDKNTIIVLPKTNVVRVKGNVYNPGLIAFNSSKTMTMSRAIELAGGFKPYSLKKRAYVVRSNGEVERTNLFRGRAKRVFPGDSIFVPLDANPQDFDITSFIADLSSTLANIAAILLIADNN